MPVEDEITKRRGHRVTGFATATLILGLVLGAPLRLEGTAQCSLTGGPVVYDDPVSTPWGYTFTPQISSVALYKDAAGVRHVVDEHNFGYAAFSLSNPLSPSLQGWEDLSLNQGYGVTGDGQTTVGAVGVAPDGSSLLIGYCYGHLTLILQPGSSAGTFRSPLYGVRQFGPGTWSVIPKGGIRVDLIGSRSIAYQLNERGIYVAEMTPGTTPALGTLPSELIVNAPVSKTVYGLDLTVDTVTGKRYLVYASAGSQIVVVDVSSPGTSIPGISARFKVTVLAPEDFGLPAGSGVTRARGAFHPTNRLADGSPALEILVDGFTSYNSSAGIALKTFDPAANNGNGGISSTDHRIPYTDPTSPY